MSILSDIRQLRSRDTLSQISGVANTELDNIVRAIDKDLTPSFVLSENSPASRVVNIGGAIVTHPETGRLHTIPPMNSLSPTFTSGTVTIDATGAGNAVPSVGSNLSLGMSASRFLKISIAFDSSGNLVLQKGSQGVTESAASLPSATAGTYPIGYIVVSTDASNNVNNITASNIYQYRGIHTTKLDWISPSLSKADLIVYNGTTHVRFPAGTDGYAIVYNSATSTGLDYASVVTNPMDSAGDLIVGGAAGVATKLDHPGATDYILNTNSSTGVTWTTYPQAFGYFGRTLLANVTIPTGYYMRSVSNTVSASTVVTISTDAFWDVKGQLTNNGQIVVNGQLIVD